MSLIVDHRRDFSTARNDKHCSDHGIRITITIIITIIVTNTNHTNNTTNNNHNNKQ